MREPVTEATETWEIIYTGSDQAHHLTREHIENLGHLVDATFPDHFPITGIRLSRGPDDHPKINIAIRRHLIKKYLPFPFKVKVYTY